MKRFLYFNLNDSIYVKLKEEGYVHYMNEYNSWMPFNLKRPLEYFKAKADADGYVAFQVWYFMQMFGSTINMGLVPIFDNNIKIKVNDLIEKQNSQEKAQECDASKDAI